MKKPNRLFLYAPLAVGAVFLAVWAFLWAQGAAMMRTRIKDLAEAQAARGRTLTYGEIRTRGFPFYLRGEISAPAWSDGRGGSYAGDALYVDFLPYQPDRIILSPGGDQRFTWRGETWAIVAEDARASLEINDERGWFLRAETGPTTIESPLRAARFDRLVVNVAPTMKQSKSRDVSLVADNLSLPAKLAPFLIGKAETTFTVTPTDASGPGKLALKGLALDAAGGRIEAAGEIGVTPDRQADGRVDARLMNPQAIAKSLGQSGVLEPREASAAEALLGLMAKQNGGEVRAPIVLKAGEARLLGVKIAKLPPIP